MKILVINVAEESGRLNFQEAQMDALGLAWERVEAVTPRTLSPPASNPLWHRWQRPILPTEMALTASHMVTWRRVVYDENPCLILEDDAFLSSETPAVLDLLSNQSDLEHVTLENRRRRKIVARQRDSKGRPIRRLIQDRAGAAAYVLWPKGARKLLEIGETSPGPADAMISDCNTLNSWQAWPALSIQLEHCVHYGLTPPYVTNTSVHLSIPIDRRIYPSLKRFGFRFRRFRTQIEMGMRLLVHFPITEKSMIPISEEWPTVEL